MQSDREQSARLHAGLVFGSHHKGAAGKLSTADLRSRDEQELRWQVQTTIVLCRYKDGPCAH